MPVSPNLSEAELASYTLKISREFDAPKEMVFKAWTEAERLAQWWGPKGCKINIAKLDLAPGGIFHYQMLTPDGNSMWGKFIYQDIEPSERLVFTNSFSDEQGNTARAPFSETWPLELLSTLTLAEQNGKTTLTMQGIPINATQAEMDTFKGMHDGMQQGWTGTLDQLAAYLANA